MTFDLTFFLELDDDKKIHYFKTNECEDKCFIIMDHIDISELHENISLSKTFFDRLNKNEIHEFFFIKEKFSKIIIECANAYDEENFIYLINESKVVKRYFPKLYSYFDINEILFGKDMFSFIELIIKSNTPKSDGIFYYYKDMFDYYVKNNSLYNIITLVENFDIDPMYLVDAMFISINSRSPDTCKYLVRHCMKYKLFDELHSDFHNLLFEQLNTDEKNDKNSKEIDSLLDELLDSLKKSLSNV